MRPAMVVAASILVATFVPTPPAGTAAASCGPRLPVSFSNVTTRSGIAYDGKSWGSAWGDLNGDGYPDLYTSNHTNADTLWLNRGDGTFQPLSTPLGQHLDTHGAMWGDVNDDHHEDVVVLTDSGGGTTPKPHLLINDGAGHLVDRTSTYDLNYTPSRGRMPLWLDSNDDGRLDLLIPTLRRTGSNDLPTALFQQTASGTFTNVSRAVGLHLSATTQFAQLTNLTGDRNLELVTKTTVGSAGESESHGGAYPTHVYDMQTVPFTDRLASSGLPTVQPMQDAFPADLNDDGATDLVTTGGENPNDVLIAPPGDVRSRLQPRANELGFSFRASGSVTFAVYPLYLADRLGVDRIFIGSGGRHPDRVVNADHGLTFTLSPSDPTVAGTYPHRPGVDTGIYVGYRKSSRRWSLRYSEPQHGDLVVFAHSASSVSGLRSIGFDPSDPGPANHLFLSTPTGYADATSSSGLPVRSQSVNVSAADVNDDGYLDLFLVNTRGAGNVPDALFLNDGDGTFTRVPDAGGAAGPRRRGRGDDVSVADYNDDGFPDLFVANGRKPDPFHAPYQLFRNLGNGNHWLDVNLVGNGTTANVDAIGASVRATTGTLVQPREQNGGIHERGAQNFQRVHFGLGCATSVDVLQIRWPDGRLQTLRDVAADRIITIREPSS